MDYVFFGSPKFAEIILDKLISAGFVPRAVVCNPDRPVGRKHILTAPAVKELIANRKSQIEIMQPEDVKTIRDSLLALRPDFSIVAAYAQIIPKEIVELPRLGTVGVHPSLLPKYRGASPIQSAILNGEEKTGVTLYLLDEKMDHGKILGSRVLGIGSGDNYESLLEKLAEIGGNLLIETLPKFLKGKIEPQSQNEHMATYTKKFSSGGGSPPEADGPRAHASGGKTEDAYVDPKDLERAQNEGGEIAFKIERRIRALNPEPGVWTMNNGKRLKLLAAEIKDGKLRLTKIQKEGRKPLKLF